MKAIGRRQGHTKPLQKQEPVPRMPHERDESSDSQNTGTPRPEIRQAHDDMAAGRVDTDRAAPMDAAYQRQKEPPNRTLPKGGGRPKT